MLEMTHKKFVVQADRYITKRYAMVIDKKIIEKINKKLT